MTSQYNTSSWRDDYEASPALASIMRQLDQPRTVVPNWPFPAKPAPVDRTPPPVMEKPCNPKTN